MQEQFPVDDSGEKFPGQSRMTNNEELASILNTALVREGLLPLSNNKPTVSTSSGHLKSDNSLTGEKNNTVYTALCDVKSSRRKPQRAIHVVERRLPSSPKREDISHKENAAESMKKSENGINSDVGINNAGHLNQLTNEIVPQTQTKDITAPATGPLQEEITPANQIIPDTLASKISFTGEDASDKGKVNLGDLAGEITTDALTAEMPPGELPAVRFDTQLKESAVPERSPPSMEKFLAELNTLKENKCSECGKVFKHRYDLKKHFIVHTGQRPWVCEVCSKSFTRPDYLQVHMRIHSGYRPYKCEECGKDYYEGSAYRRHMRTHSGIKPYSCEYCGKGFAAKHHFKTHLRIHTGDKPYKCPHCEKGFTQSQDLQRHVRKHTGDKPFKCDVCDRSFIQKNVLMRHKQVHDGSRPFQCEICLKYFVRKEVMKQHVSSVHIGTRNFSCPQCDKKFSQKYHLKKHMSTHSGDKPFQCNMCSKSYFLKCELEHHIKLMHTGEVEYKCQICQKNFNCDSNLKAHLKLHKRNTEHSCDVCHVLFNEAPEFEAHILSHVPSVPPFSCNVCLTADFPSLEEVVLHFREHHTGSDAQSCIRCGQVFSTKEEVSDHMQIHLKPKEYTCPVCGRIFTHGSNLRRHKKTHEKRNTSKKYNVPYDQTEEIAKFLNEQQAFEELEESMDEDPSTESSVQPSTCDSYIGEFEQPVGESEEI